MLLGLCSVPVVGGLIFLLARWEAWALTAPVRPARGPGRHRGPQG